MARGIKIGGGILAVVVVCVAGWYLFLHAEGAQSINRFLKFGSRKLLSAKAAPSHRMIGLPKVYLWAWERPEDLKFLSDQKTGVAFLADTIYLKSGMEKAGADRADGKDDVIVHRRMQPLRIVPGTPLTAVVRIETFAGTKTSGRVPGAAPQVGFSKTQLMHAADEIAAAVNFPGVSAIQIDFDATLGEHDFYRALLVEIRKRLPGEIPLSITALASWCIGDRWLEQLPPGTIDEAVPMLFRMGTGEREVMNFISSGEEYRVAVCRGSIGVSTDEIFSRSVLSGNIATGSRSREPERIYVFSPRAWDQANAKTTLEAIRTWHAN